MSIKVIKIHRWHGDYEWLNNKYLSPMMYSGDLYPSLAHAFLASKSNDQKVRNFVRKLSIAELDQNFDLVGETRDKSWHASTVMMELLEIKFGLIQTNRMEDAFLEPMKLQKRLISTGEAELVWTNLAHDNWWGACACQNCIKKEKKNLLGFALMSLRQRARQKIDSLTKNPVAKKCFCNGKATNILLFSREWEMQLKGYCDKAECVERTIKFCSFISSDGFFVNYTPNQSHNILYMSPPKSSEPVNKTVESEIVNITDQVIETEKPKIEDECDGYCGSGIPMGFMGPKTTTVLVVDRKYETLVIKGK